MEAGRFEIVEQDFALAETIDEAKRLLDIRAQKAGLALSSDIGADIARVYADRKLVAQALLNLLSNAVKFTPEATVLDVKQFLVAMAGDLETMALRIVSNLRIAATRATFWGGQPPWARVDAAIRGLWRTATSVAMYNTPRTGARPPRIRRRPPRVPLSQFERGHADERGELLAAELPRVPAPRR